MDRGFHNVAVRQRGSAVTALLVALAAWATPAAAQSDSVAGQFFVRSAYTDQVEGVYYMTADIDYSLTEAATKALMNGVPLTFEMQIEVNYIRRFMPDNTIATLVNRYEVAYHPLSERFVIRNLNSGQQKSYGTLSSALRALGDVDAFPILDASLLKPNKDYYVRLRSILDIKSFPGPLRVLASLFRIGDWRLASEWQVWALNP